MTVTRSSDCFSKPLWAERVFAIWQLNRFALFECCIDAFFNGLNEHGIFITYVESCSRRDIPWRLRCKGQRSNKRILLENPPPPLTLIIWCCRTLVWLLIVAVFQCCFYLAAKSVSSVCFNYDQCAAAAGSWPPNIHDGWHKSDWSRIIRQYLMKSNSAVCINIRT